MKKQIFAFGLNRFLSFSKNEPLKMKKKMSLNKGYQVSVLSGGMYTLRICIGIECIVSILMCVR